MAARKLKTLLGEHAVTAAFKSRQVTSLLVDFDFADVKVPNTAFKRVVRDNEFDVAELAIVTFLMAKAAGAPLTLLPAVLMARFQHPYLVTVAGRGMTSPRDLAGRRIGIRSYTVTTVVWLRQVLAMDYGIDLAGIEWITFEDAHVAGFADPPHAVRAAPGKDLKTMLLDGEIEAAIMPGTNDDARIVPLIADPSAAAHDWANRYGAIQTNHMMVVKTPLVESHPQIVREIYRLLSASKQIAANVAGNVDAFTPFGIEANRRNLEVAIEATYSQGLIPRRFGVDELFADTASLFA